MRFLLFLFVVVINVPSAFAEGTRFIGDNKTYKAVYEDTFVDIARREGLGFVELRSANPDTDPWLPGAGTEIFLPHQHLLPDAPRQGVVINLPEMRLYHFNSRDGQKSIDTYPIGAGRIGLNTPLGQTTVTRKTIGPRWYPTDRMKEENPNLPEVVKPGFDNPLGTHAVYLNWPSYAIHGTNRPYGIGRRVSSGCIRLYPEDIIQFYDNIEIGSLVTVVNQPIKTAWINDGFYIEVHPTLEETDTIEKHGKLDEYSVIDEERNFVKDVMGKQYAAKLNQVRLDQALMEKRGVPVMIYHKDQDGVGVVLDAESSDQTTALSTQPIEKTAKSQNPRPKFSLN